MVEIIPLFATGPFAPSRLSCPEAFVLLPFCSFSRKYRHTHISFLQLHTFLRMQCKPKRRILEEMKITLQKKP
jgi:hypothetical protein